MPESALAENLASELAAAIRILLAQPMLDSEADPDGFRIVVRHAADLVEYFDNTCGWQLTVDAAAGFARLAKRSPTIDDIRPLKRVRGNAAPFDRRRYELLCVVCAELVRHPVTTIGLLADAVTADAGLDSSRYGERIALVDALRVLIAWGAVKATAGDVDAFVDSDRGNAILSADTARLHHLLGSAAAPSSLPEDLTTEEATDRLVAEPRYGDAADADGEVEGSARHRWARHTLARKVLDQPVTYIDDLSPIEAEYLASPSGRRWLRDRVAKAGFEFEERAEGVLAVDEDAVATDRPFPAPMGNAHQLALLLADQLVSTDVRGRRHLRHLTASQLAHEVDMVFREYPSWAKGQRDDGGPERLGHGAVDLLASFGLVRRDPDGSVVARPALARYRVGKAVVSAAPTLFEEDT